MNTLCTLTVCGLAAGVASAQIGATFSLITDPVSGGVAVSADDMSPDGRWIVGGMDFDGDFLADAGYRWDRVNNVFTVIMTDSPTNGLNPASAVSDDGSVVLGSIPGVFDFEAQEAAIWTDADGWTSLGFLPNAGACPSRSNGYELSGDGTIAVGLSWEGCSGRGFIWTAADGMLPLETLGLGGNRASVVSADGSVIAGFAQGNTRTPAMWDGTTLQGTLLDPTYAIGGEFNGISDDGSVLLGSWWFGGTVFEAGKIVNGVASKVGDGALLPGWSGTPMDIADNGTIVGFDRLLGNRRAWIQPEGTGPLREAVAYLNGLGAGIAPGISLQVLQAVSTNGRFIVGHTGGFGAFLITLDYALTCDADLNGDGVLNFFDVSNFIGFFNAQDPSADVDDNGLFNFFDVSAYIALYNKGCSND
jgi:uncharacterized membrane protein